MRNGILTNWTITRLLYLIMGVLLVVQSVYEQQYFGLAFGAYFMAMGIFNFGCAAGGCYGNACSIDARQKPDDNTVEPVFEEIKNK